MKSAEETVRAVRETAAAVLFDVMKKAQETAQKTTSGVKKAADKATEKKA